MSQTWDIPPESSGTNSHTPHVPSTTQHRIGQIVLAVSNILLVATFFTPWMDLTTSFGNRPGTYGYSPLFLIQLGIPIIAVVGLLAPFLAILACTSLLLVSRNQQIQGMFLALLVFQDSVYLVIILFLFSFAPLGLNLGYPYYSVAMDYGIWLALGGFIGVLLGAFVLLDGRARGRRSHVTPAAPRSHASL